MSLRHAADGILETHVTWKEFEERLREALRTTAVFGPNKRARDIGEGNGFASRCALIDCDWQGENADQLPPRVVLKMASCLALQARMGDAPAAAWTMIEKSIRNVHNIECYVYDLIERFGGAHAVPRRFYSRKFDDENDLAGQICMEYAESSQMMQCCEAASLDQMKEIARALGKLQAESTKIAIDSNSLKTTDAFADYTKTMTKEQFTGVFKRLKELEPSLIERLEKVEAIMGEYHGTSLPLSIHKQLGIKPVLVNGDMRTENVLVDVDTGDLRFMIDWQLSHLGVGVEDLLRISFFAQATSDRRAFANELIEEMYNAFVNNLDHTPAPITLDQPNKPPPGNDDEEKQRRYEVCLNKARGVLEDIVKYHEINKNSERKIDWNHV